MKKRFVKIVLAAALVAGFGFGFTKTASVKQADPGGGGYKPSTLMVDSTSLKDPGGGGY